MIRKYPHCSPAMLQSGQILCDRYQLQDILGQTAGRQTWLATDITSQPPEAVVVKLLLFGDQVQWEHLKLFEREAQILRQLDHPQIPKYRDFFSMDDRLLWFGLVQEYIPGESLRTLLARGERFTEAQVRQVAVNLLHLLRYLHELHPPVLHRDIKPSNLIWGEDNFIYLVDFGAVQDKAAIEGATFTVVGTYGYAPMEQFGGRSVPASDLYALGATLIHLLTGTAPADLPQQNLQIQFRDRITLDPKFAQWIEVLVNPDVGKRFQSAVAALAALQDSSWLQPPSLQLWQAVQAETNELVPPLKTRIIVEQTDVALRLIFLPPKENLYALTGLAVAIALLVSLPLLFGWSLVSLLKTIILLLVHAWIPVLILMIFVMTAIWQMLSPVYVHFGLREFVIYRKILGRQWTFGWGNLHEIRNVFHTIKTVSTGRYSENKRYIVVQTNTGEEAFGAGLKWEEGDWLVGLVQKWVARHY